MIGSVIPSDDFSAFYATRLQAVITDMNSITKPTNAPIKSEDSEKIAVWGDSNDFPQKVIADVKQDPELPNLLTKKAQLLYSGGLVHGKLVLDDKTGEEKILPLDPKLDLEIRTWRRTANLNRYLFEGAKDLYFFYNVFPEVVLSVDRKKILQLCVQPAEQ
jgi:hypothetical protein